MRQTKYEKYHLHCISVNINNYLSLILLKEGLE